MISKIQLNDLTVEITRKKMKNIHLRIYPNGTIKLSAPQHINQENLRTFLISKLNWIEKKLAKFQNQQRASTSSNHHYVWGKRYLLNVIEQDTRPSLRRG